MARQRSSGSKERQIDPKAVVDLLGTTELLHQHLTGALCALVFKAVRITERARKWTLQKLAEFWTAVILRAPDNLTQALQEAARGASGWPQVEATPEAFFARCKDMKWRFFADLFAGFRDSILPSAPVAFAPELHSLRRRFKDIFIVDGSRLEKIAHRLKILHHLGEAVLPGCMLAVYDLFRGIPRWIQFHADAAYGELRLLKAILGQIPEGTLLMGDRLYASVALVEQLRLHKLCGLFRRNGHLIVKEVRRLGRTEIRGVVFEDWLVDVGGGSTAPIQPLRLIRKIEEGEIHELLTTVMDPRQLSAEEAMMLYPRRWDVERMFFDLKEVLNLHRLYAANPNAIAMQLYAAAIVYVAMRVAQARVALDHQLDPALISPKKFFVRMAVASSTLVGFKMGCEAMREANPGRRLVVPDPKGQAFVTAQLGSLLVEARDPSRRKKRRPKNRHRWLSFRHIKGHDYIEN
jgi:hypothetical protein